MSESCDFCSRPWEVLDRGGRRCARHRDHRDGAEGGPPLPPGYRVLRYGEELAADREEWRGSGDHEAETDAVGAARAHAVAELRRLLAWAADDARLGLSLEEPARALLRLLSPEWQCRPRASGRSWVVFRRQADGEEAWLDAFPTRAIAEAVVRLLARPTREDVELVVAGLARRQRGHRAAAVTRLPDGRELEGARCSAHGRLRSTLLRAEVELPHWYADAVFAP